MTQIGADGEDWIWEAVENARRGLILSANICGICGREKKVRRSNSRCAAGAPTIRKKGVGSSDLLFLIDCSQAE
jgi:hypothetical protein